ncbi:polysaccharide biosynthesis protein [Aliikangiella sp. IMCC44653]
MKTIIESVLNAPRSVKRGVALTYDSFSILVSIIFAVNLDNSDILVINSSSLSLLFIVGVISTLTFIKLGFYRAILRYIGIKTIFILLAGVSLSTLCFLITFKGIYRQLDITHVFLYWSFLTILIGGSRLLLKGYIESRDIRSVNVAIYGAGAAGRQLASALEQGDYYKPVIFIDDDKNLHHSKINGLEVVSFKEFSTLIHHKNISRVLLALPSTTHKRKSEILTLLEPLPLKVKTIAGVEDIVNGNVNIEEIKEIEIEDLLGRDSVEPNKELLQSCIVGKVVMVTGAGGSIGAELCRQIVVIKPKVLVLYELSEFALYSIDKELNKLLKKKKNKPKIISLLGSVQHRNRLLRAMSQYNVQTVYHAAAYKHVPIVEHNIVEGIRNNVFGTWYAAEAAVQAGVERFVLISTDKAVRPTNVMGASKRLAELVLQAVNSRKEKTLFTMVRFGNVLGSSGSVVPLFREQIKNGGPVTVTHKDIIRYFMTIPEAAQLVLQAGALGKGGDVFVLDMGDQVKISELAERMVHLMGLSVKSKSNPHGDIEIQFSGLRPGEKLYEELLVGENVEGTEHPKIMSANEISLPWNEMQKALLLLNELCEEMDCEGIVQMLLKLPTGYNPQHAVCDLLWHEDKDKNNVVRFKTLT